MNALAAIGARTLALLRGWGHAALFFFDLVRVLPQALRDRKSTRLNSSHQ